MGLSEGRAGAGFERFLGRDDGGEGRRGEGEGKDGADVLGVIVGTSYGNAVEVKLTFIGVDRTAAGC